MPIYEFVCRECGTQFEHLQSFSAHGHPPCPNCQSMHVSRMMSKPAIHFKGSGWYITDSKSSSRQSANGEAPDRGEKGEKSGEKSGDSIAEKKSDGASAKGEASSAGSETAAPKSASPDAPASRDKPANISST
jgi:putative FmdB family regulatory protein